MKKNHCVLTLLVLFMVLTAFQIPAFRVMTAVAVTQTPAPSKTPLPGEAAGTPTPSLPVLGKASEYLNDVKVIFTDNFDSYASSANWSFSNSELIDGVLIFTGKNWNGTNRLQTIKTLQGSMIDFSYAKGSNFQLFIDNEGFGMESYRRFGININNGKVIRNTYQGKQGFFGTRNIKKDLGLKQDTTYSILIAVLPNGKFFCTIWNPADPKKSIIYQEDAGAEWSGREWTFWIQANPGKVKFDNYQEISFSGMK